MKSLYFLSIVLIWSIFATNGSKINSSESETSAVVWLDLKQLELIGRPYVTSLLKVFTEALANTKAHLALFIDKDGNINVPAEQAGLPKFILSFLPIYKGFSDAVGEIVSSIEGFETGSPSPDNIAIPIPALNQIKNDLNLIHNTSTAVLPVYNKITVLLQNIISGKIENGRISVPTDELLEFKNALANFIVLIKQQQGSFYDYASVVFNLNSPDTNQKLIRFLYSCGTFNDLLSVACDQLAGAVSNLANVIDQSLLEAKGTSAEINILIVFRRADSIFEKVLDALNLIRTELSVLDGMFNQISVQ